MKKVSTQLVEIVKLIVQNEMQLVQQKQKETSQVHSRSAEVVQRGGPEAASEIITYTGGHQGPQLG